MYADDNFVWTFPTYLLAKNFVIDSAGNIHFDRDLRFIAPAVTPDGELGIAMFTDFDLAQEYLELTDQKLEMRLRLLHGLAASVSYQRHAPILLESPSGAAPYNTAQCGS